MRNKIIITFAIVVSMVGCTNAPSEEKKPAMMQPTGENSEIKKVIKQEQLATKRDPVCRMPVWKYLTDTTLYKGNIYGFCGKGCKDEFLKKPEEYAQKTKL